MQVKVIGFKILEMLYKNDFFGKIWKEYENAHMINTNYTMVFFSKRIVCLFPNVMQKSIIMA